MKKRTLMKRLTAVAVVVAMAAGLIACGAKEEETGSETAEETQQEEAEEAEETEIQVFIAASLNTVMTELAEMYNE